MTRLLTASARCSVSASGSTATSLLMAGPPLDGMSFGVAGTITPLVDLRADHRRLPDHMRAVPKG